MDHGLDVGAVVADEHHQQALGAAGRGRGVALAVDAGQVEVDGRAAEVADGGGGADHCCCLPGIFGSYNGQMITRILCPQGLAPGAHVALPETAAHHVARVLRLKEGDALTLFDGRGGEWAASHRAHPQGRGSC